MAKGTYPNKAAQNVAEFRAEADVDSRKAENKENWSSLEGKSA